jgi:hypothetical protein
MEKYDCILTDEQRQRLAFFSRRNRKQGKVLIHVVEKQGKGKGNCLPIGKAVLSYDGETVSRAKLAVCRQR